MKRVLFTALLIVTLLISTAGCSQTKTGVSSNANDSSEIASQETNELFKNDVRLEPLSGNEKTITVLYDTSINIGIGYLDQELPKVKEELIAKKAQYDEGLSQYFITKTLYNYNVKNNNVRLKLENWGWGDPLLQKQTSAFISKMGPNIMIGENQMPDYAKEGQFEPFPKWLEDICRKELVGIAYKAMEQDGKIYGVCAQPSTTILIWNKDVLRKAGVDSKYIDTAPKTWDEFLQVSKTIKESGTGKYFAGGIYAGANIGGYLRIAPFVQMAGGSFVDASGNPEFSNAGNIKALEMLRELSTYNQFGMLASTQEQTMYNAFNQGKMAYLVEGSWRIKQSKSIGLDVGFGMLPSPTGKETSNTLIGACYYSVPKYATDKEESFKVIASIISKEVQSEIAKYDLRPVVRLDVGNKEEYKTLSPNQSFVFDIFKNSVVSSLPTFNKNSSKIWQSYGEALVKATTTKDNIKDVLNKAQAQAKTVQ